MLAVLSGIAALHGFPCCAEGNSASSRLLEVAEHTAQGRLSFTFRGRPLLTYAFAATQFKPYVRELFTLSGTNVLRDAPADHLHHHGLMYAIRINGVNFWEETDSPGREQHIKFTSIDANGASGSFTEKLHWLPSADPPDAAPFLIETRTLTISVAQARDEVSLGWHASFEVGPRANRIRLHGSDYNGLGLRLPETWDRSARHENSENAAYITAGKRDVFPARWAAVREGSDNSPQVVLFGDKVGNGGTTMFFSMTDPFTYLSVTQGLDKTPLEYKDGDRFQTRYLVLVYSKARAPHEIEARYRQWLSQLK